MRRQFIRSLWFWTVISLLGCMPAAPPATPTPALPTAGPVTPTAGPVTATAGSVVATAPPPTSPPPSRTPEPTATLFAERVNTRPPGTLTPTLVFPTITPQRQGLRLWTRGSRMPTQRLELGSAVVNGKIYAVGGSHVRGLTYARMEVYDPATDSWATAAPLPIGRHHFGIAALNGKIYVSGGLADWYQFTNTCFVYDPATDEWSPIAPLPHDLGTHAMAALDGKLYVVGGHNTPAGGGPMAMFVYDPATDVWARAEAPMPLGREHLAAVTAEGKLYVIGGRINQDVNVPFVEIYDPQLGTWTRGPDMPVAVSGITGVYLEGRIHITGGEDLFAGRTFNEHQVLDLTTMTWELWPALPAARHGLTSQVVNGRWIVIGGAPMANMAMTDRVDIFVP